jgi:NTP pyrophosphatase (non-canonical NTP hydrolase)
MTFNQYQAETNKTAQYPKKELALYYLGLGIAGEAGEVAEKIKKILRNDNGEVSDEKKSELKKELGDILWYMAQLGIVLGFEFDEVATTNLAKLQDRLNRGVIKSQGDNR